MQAGEVVGRFDRLSGVQGSPCSFLPGVPDRTERYREYRIERARIDQDCPPNSLTLGGIFPDETADPERPDSYHFEEIDRHVLAARAAGTRVLWQASYDIGASDHWVGFNLGGRPPKDRERWARVVEHCLEHFNAGWANGHRGLVESVEFPNEPNGLGGFNGAHGPELLPTFLRFIELVEGFNQRHPEASVRAVGPGIPLCWPDWPAWEPRFDEGLRALHAAGRTLPVLSFHTYGSDVAPVSNARLAQAFRALLDRHGMQQTELWNTEWQAGEFLERHLRIDAARRARATQAERKSYVAAAATYALACKSRWQGVVTGSIYYRATERAYSPEHPEAARRSAAAGNELFFAKSGKLGALALQERLTDLAVRSAPQRCRTVFADDGLLTALGLRSVDGQVVGVLATNLAMRPRRLAVTFTGLAPVAPAVARAWTIDGAVDELVERATPLPEGAIGGPVLPVELAPLTASLTLVSARSAYR